MEALRHLAGVAPGDAVSRVSMRERASERVLGTALGVALAPLAAALGFVRGKRVVHPVGAAFHARGRRRSAHRVPLVEGTVLGQPGRYSAIARLSRGFAMPLRWPDVHGLAVRILDADGAGRPQDLLVATAKRKRSGRDATAVTPRYEHLFSTMLHFRGPQGDLVVRAWPVQPMPGDATVHAGVAGRWQFELAVGSPGGEVSPRRPRRARVAAVAARHGSAALQPCERRRRHLGSGRAQRRPPHRLSRESGGPSGAAAGGRCAGLSSVRVRGGRARRRPHRRRPCGRDRCGLRDAGARPPRLAAAS